MASKACTFTGANGTALEDYSVGGEATWTEHPSIAVGTVVITDANRCRANTAGNASVQYVDNFTPESADYDVSATLRCLTVPGSDGFQLGVGGRAGTASFTGYYLLLQRASATWELALFRGGNGTPIATYATGTPSVDTTYALKLTMRSGVIKGYFDAGTSATTERINITPTGGDIVSDVGVPAIFALGVSGAVSNSTGIHMDDFLAEDPVSAATEYSLTGPDDGAKDAASTDFSVNPNGTFTGTVTPSDGGAGGTFTPSSLTWTATGDVKTFTYTPIIYGTITISATNNGGLTDPDDVDYESHTGAVDVDSADLWFNGRDNVAAPRQTAFSELRLTTNATTLKVTGTTTIYGAFPLWAELVVFIDGVAQSPSAFSANGQQEFTFSGLGSASKSIVIRGGLQELSGTVLGSFIDSFQLEGLTSYSLTVPAEADTVVIYGDSITAGANASIPATEAWTTILRDGGRDVHVEAWGARSLHDDTGTAGALDTGKADAFAAYLLGLDPDTIYLAIGINDDGLNKWIAADFQTAYAYLVDKLHTLDASVKIVCQSPLITNHAIESSLPAYRDAIEAVCSTRAWAHFIDGTDILELPDLSGDNVHPSTAGQAEYAAYVDGALPVTYTLRVRAYNGGGSGASASTTFDE